MGIGEAEKHTSQAAVLKRSFHLLNIFLPALSIYSAILRVFAIELLG